MAFDGEFVLKVKPEDLEAKAKTISDSIKNIETAFKKIQTEVNGTKSYWKGQASGKHYKMFDDNKDEIQKVIKRLKEHPTDLLEMAGIYKQVEKANVNLARTLDADIIE